MKHQYARLRQYISDEMKRRDIGVRDFAKILNVAPSTISKLTDPRENYEPGLDVLRKIARGTGVTLSAILELIEVEDGQSARTENELLSLQLSKLTEEQRRIVLNLIRGFLIGEKLPDHR